MPSEFVLQKTVIANPPSIFLVIEKLVDRFGGDYCTSSDSDCDTSKIEKIRSYLHDIFPLLHDWMLWFLNSQLTVSSTYNGISFSWKGREFDSNRLNTNTLASGLDDYPRSMLPSSDDHHLDLLCWMIRASRTMYKLQNLYFQEGSNEDGLQLERIQKDIFDIALKCRVESEGITTAWDYNTLSQHLIEQLEYIHWSKKHNAYLDIGYHDNEQTIVNEVLIRCRSTADKSVIDHRTDAEMFGRNKISCPNTHPEFMYAIKGDSGNEPVIVSRVISEKSILPLDHVNHIGYLSIFPLLLTLLVSAFPHHIICSFKPINLFYCNFIAGNIDSVTSNFGYY